jgi:tRNA 2-selenouridine synthase
MIGSRAVPKLLYEKMRSGNTVFLNIPFEVRLHYLTGEYGKFAPEDLKEAIKRITKRLGGLGAKTALEAIDNGDIKTAFEICLTYYDKTYDYGKNKREPETIVNCHFDTLNCEEIAKKINQFKLDLTGF